MATPAWALYLRTIVDVELRSGKTLRIHPARPHDVGAWPNSLPSPVYVLTAWNPGADPLPLEVNRERQRSLEAELDSINVSRWKAIGRDTDSDYFEEGVAIHGLDEDEAIDVACRFDQDAIYSWEPSVWATLSCQDRSRIEQGWWIEPLPPQGRDGTSDR